MAKAFVSLLLVCLCAAACDPAQPTSRVAFKDSKAFGVWGADSAQDAATGSQQGPTQAVASGQNDVEDSPQSPEPGANMPPAPAADGGSPDQHKPDSMMPTAGTMSNAGGASAPAAGVPPIKLTFQVTTQTQHLGQLDKNGTCVNPPPQPLNCWGPENCGAIWVTTMDGKFVRSLEVWAILRRPELTHYAAARGGPTVKVDVTASASRVQIVGMKRVDNPPHMTTWDGTDRSGAHVPLGPYRLFVEMADCDAAEDPTCTSAIMDIPFDTQTKAPVSIPDAQYYTDMKLSIE